MQRNSEKGATERCERDPAGKRGRGLCVVDGRSFSFWKPQRKWSSLSLQEFPGMQESRWRPLPKNAPSISQVATRGHCLLGTRSIVRTLDRFAKDTSSLHRSQHTHAHKALDPASTLKMKAEGAGRKACAANARQTSSKPRPRETFFERERERKTHIFYEITERTPQSLPLCRRKRVRVQN